MSKVEICTDANGFTSRVEFPEDIADVLCQLTGVAGEIERQACVDALYQIRATAENPYNSDYYRVFYTVLSRLTDLPDRRASEETGAVRLGEWKLAQNNRVSSIFSCSECGREVTIMNPYYGKPTPHAAEYYPYCHCGAKMVSRKEDGNV